MNGTEVARRSFDRGRADAIADAARFLDELARQLPEEIERHGVDAVAASLRLSAGIARARADQIRSSIRRTGKA
jgi:hypothetical protein